MERHFDEELTSLKRQILKMGGLAETMIREAVKALVQHDQELLQPIYDQENQVNHLQVEIDETCVRLIALHQPMAGDLRLLLGVSRINSELERLGDHAINIAGTVYRLLQEPQLKPFETIPEMVELASGMVKDSLHAFVHLDAAKARDVLSRDRALNALKDKVTAELMDYMRRDPSTISRALNLVIVARNLERMGDHAKNIAEDVVFVAEGKDIRHPFEKKPPQKL